MSGNEFLFIDWLREQIPASDDVLIGIGDDAALVAPISSSMVYKVDSVLEGVHFQLDDPNGLGYLTPKLAGRKAIARALSDIAAMGASPRYALVAGTLGPQHGLETAKEVMRGILECAKEFQVQLIGGETSAWKQSGGMVLSVTLIADAGERTPKRGDALAGHQIWVTGQLGASLEQERHATFAPRIAEGQWLASYGVGAMMDVSDGLESDLRHIAKASGLAIEIDAEALPIHPDVDPEKPIVAALCDGEDYELVFSISPQNALQIQASWPFECPLSRIGSCIEGEPELWIKHGQERFSPEPGAWRHSL